jgi:hypothetical protein
VRPIDGRPGCGEKPGDRGSHGIGGPPQEGWIYAARLFRDSTVGHPHLGQLPRRDPQLGSAASRTRMPVLRRRPACHHDLAGAGNAAAADAGTGRRHHRLRRQPRAAYPVPPIRRAGACAARLDLQLRRPHRLAQPHDAVQGQGGEGPRSGVGRPLRLSEPDGRRHPRLSRDPRAGGRRPEAAPGARERHWPEVQSRLREGLLPADRSADHARGGARDVAAGRDQEDVEIGSLGSEPDQSQRRRRHDRGQNPPGPDRPRAAAERARGAGGPRATSSASMGHSRA